jgi:hypothetical protein
MAQALDWLISERTALVVECGPVILLLIAWLAFRPLEARLPRKARSPATNRDEVP